MLAGKLEIIIFEETVHEDDELAHTGGHGDERFLSCRPQTEVKLFEDAVVPDRAQGGHVKGVSGGTASAADVAQAVLTTTVAVVRSDSCQGRRRFAW